MKQIISRSYLVLFCCLLDISTVSAQIETDKTLPINSDVIKNGINFKINGGTARGNNLFHSFKKFNIPTGGEAFFNNATSVENIFTRVTGGSISNIDGIIKANGSANLFFINPSGIIFGENAKLNIGGSFFGTTAENVKFTEGEFSAINPQAPPLLTINVPLGLQMGNNPGEIAVKGSGHNLITQNATFAPIINPGNTNFLKVQPGKTLALIGGDIQLEGGILNAETGRVELSSVKDEEVHFNHTAKGFALNISPNSRLGNIQLSQQSLIDVGGEGAGDIQINGNSVSLKDGSMFFVQNRGIQPAGDINVNTTEFLEINGLSADGTIPSALLNETLAGSSGDINIFTQRLIVKDGGAIGNRTFNFAPGGNISLTATESIEVSGFSELNPAVFTAIGSITLADGKSGDISLKTKQLSVLDGAAISATTFGNGDSGDVNINAQTIEVKGRGFGVFTYSNISSSAFGKGDGGNINIDTKNLAITEETNINTNSSNSGDAGNITINATEYIQVDKSFVSSTADSNKELQNLFNLPDLASGDGGNVTINTPFFLLDNGELDVSNFGTGDAGILKINADLLRLDNAAKLSATTLLGEGGNISLNTQSLQMRRGSNISTSAGGKGNGGNISINTDTLVALENSDITANAENSFGGKVTINAQGIFGTQQQEEITNQSDITASSELGASFNGIVELNTPGIDPNSGVNELPFNVIDTSNQIASGCLAQPGNTFVITGRGGMPQNPSRNLILNRSWHDLRDLSAYRKQADITQTTEISKQRKIVEATGFVKNALGEVELVAQTAENSGKWQQLPNCGEV